MSPFVTCHRGTSRAAGAPWGAFLGQERVHLQLPVFQPGFPSCPALPLWDQPSQCPQPVVWDNLTCESPIWMVALR